MVLRIIDPRTLELRVTNHNREMGILVPERAPERIQNHAGGEPWIDLNPVVGIARTRRTILSSARTLIFASPTSRAYWIYVGKSNSGRYSAITTPPIRTPSPTISSGSISAVRPSTISWTSRSYASATFVSM